METYSDSDSDSYDYDVAVLGGGPGGYVAAIRAARRGARVCCIEAGQLGGTCLNLGCIPTKAMLHASELFANMARSGEFGFTSANPQVDGTAFMQRVTKVVGGLRNGVAFLLKARKVNVINGRGWLVAPDTLAIETAGGIERIKAKSIIIATGSRPTRPAFLPWDSDRIITTDEATTLPTLPESVLIIGGGVIGCEFATVYAELGIATTVVEMLDRLAPDLDQDVSKEIAKSLARRGVKILTGEKVIGMNANGSTVTAKLENAETVEAACALVAIGREPNTERIGLEDVGVELTGKIIRVDDRCRTNVEGVYAIGDVAETQQYAHLASRMGIVAADNATGHEADDDRKVVPACVYTHPEAATVGFSEAYARDQCADVHVGRFPYRASGMGHAYGETEGMVKLIGDKADGTILGAVVIGRHASDVVQEIALAMRNGLTIGQIAETIHPHPSFVEGINEAAEVWLGLPVHGAG